MHAAGAAPGAGFVEPRTASIKRLGVWMMPDNAARGMMETFLLALRPSANAALLAYAESAADVARVTHEAPFPEVHRDKAIIHTWLAWQEPPGRQMHDAVKLAMLDATLHYAAPFIAWFEGAVKRSPRDGAAVPLWRRRCLWGRRAHPAGELRRLPPPRHPPYARPPRLP